MLTNLFQIWHNYSIRYVGGESITICPILTFIKSYEVRKIQNLFFSFSTKIIKELLMQLKMDKKLKNCDTLSPILIFSPHL